LVGNLNCTPLDFNFHPSTGASRLSPTQLIKKLTKKFRRNVAYLLSFMENKLTGNISVEFSFFGNNWVFWVINLFPVPLGTIHQRTLLTVDFSLRSINTPTSPARDDTWWTVR
jgi:hypothetical protein